MVVQCPECGTRFRFPEERMKPAGVKAKCARCMHIFLAADPALEPPASAQTNTAEPAEAEGPLPGAPGEEAQSAADFSPLDEDDFPPFRDDGDDEAQPFRDAAVEEPTGEDLFLDPLPGQDLAPQPSDDLPIAQEDADAPQLPVAAFDDATSDVELQDDDAPGEDDFFAAQQKTEPAVDVVEDDFAFEEEQPEAPAAADLDDAFAFGSSDDDAIGDFTFKETDDEAERSDDFAFEAGEAETDDEFGFETTKAGSDDEFGFDDDPRDGIDPFAPAGRDPLHDDFPLEGNAALSPAPDFDERDFGADDIGPSKQTEDERDDLGFGRMDFSTAASSDTSPSPIAAAPPLPPLAPPMGGLQGGEPAPPAEKPAPSPQSASPLKKRSSMGRLLAFVLLFLVGLVALGGYFAWQGGPQEMLRILDRAGVQKAPVAPAGQIRLSDLRGYFAQNAEAGQIFVVTGQAINEFQQARSAVAIKGVLFNAQGEALMQQTVFAGNPLTEEELRTLPFQSLEERMNNQFGDGLSNLNVVPGRSIPFAIVFRELPDNLAEFTVEVTDSRPGSGS